MKRLLPALMLLASIIYSTIPINAQSGSFVVSLRNGDAVEFKLSERPKLSFPEGKLIISTSDVESEFDLTEIASTNFVGVTGVESVIDDSIKSVVFDIDTKPGHILINGCSKAIVYDLSGQQVLSIDRTNGETLDLDMTNITSGVYVIHTPLRSIKYSKR